MKGRGKRKKKGLRVARCKAIYYMEPRRHVFGDVTSVQGEPDPQSVMPPLGEALKLHDVGTPPTSWRDGLTLKLTGMATLIGIAGYAIERMSQAFSGIFRAVESHGLAGWLALMVATLVAVTFAIFRK